MPVGRIDDEDDELVDDSLNAGLLPGEATSPEGGSCSRPLCFGALLIGLLAFGGSAVLATRIYDEGHTGTTGVCKNQTCSLVFVAGGCVACDDSLDGEQFHPTLRTLEAFDPVTASWNTSYPPMPTARAMLGLGALDDVLYAVGGTHGGNVTGPCPTAANKPCAAPPYPTGKVEMFDPRTRKWTAGRSLSAPRWGLAVATSDGAIYAIGGYGPKKPGMRDGDSHIRIASGEEAEGGADRAREVYAVAYPVIEVLNPYVSDGWKRVADMQSARVFAAAAVLPYDQQGVVFVTGGRNSTSPSMTSMEAYFPGNNSWVEKAPMPVGRSSHSSVVVAGKLYVLGGRTGPQKTMLRSVDEYDPRLNTWTANIASIPKAGVMRAGAAVMNGVIHLLDGSDGPAPHSQLKVIGDVFALDTTHPSKMGQVRVAKADHHMPRASVGAAVATGPCFRCEQDFCCCDVHCKTRRSTCCSGTASGGGGGAPK